MSSITPNSFPFFYVLCSPTSVFVDHITLPAWTSSPVASLFNMPQTELTPLTSLNSTLCLSLPASGSSAQAITLL